MLARMKPQTRPPPVNPLALLANASDPNTSNTTVALRTEQGYPRRLALRGCGYRLRSTTKVGPRA
jgi:hypothetical protein